ncbi:MAG TPA: VanZ family protein [Candidatus Acidoferrales bacterium]|nr:VanZ family protein [Candidatus Acidoferrales bacterium]
MNPINWLKWWWPALVWAAAITSFSTDAFSGEHTSRFILPALHWLFPMARLETLEFAHFVMRKAAHITEYFLLGLLLLRGVRAGRGGWRMEWTAITMAIAAVLAALDELHQAFVPSRGASMRDVLIDVCGAAIAQIAFVAAMRLRASWRAAPAAARPGE